MKKLTLKDLQEKVWYRLLKVIFVGFFILIVGILVSNAYWEWRNYYPPETEEQVVRSNYKTIIQDYFDNTSVPVEERRMAWDDLHEGKIDEVNFAVSLTQNSNNTYLPKIKIEAEKKWQEENKERVKDNTWTVLSGFLQMILALGIFELLRRIFYYVLLGTFRPKHS